MNKSLPIPLVALSLGLTAGCQSAGPGTEGEEDVDALVGAWNALLVADVEYPVHEIEMYDYYYGGQITIERDATAELEIYEDLTGYFDLNRQITYTYNGQPYEYAFSTYLGVNVPEVDGNVYRIVLRSEGEVFKLDCTLSDPKLECADQFERAWEFERDE